MKVVIEKGDKISEYEKIKENIKQEKKKEPIISKSNKEKQER